MDGQPSPSLMPSKEPAELSSSQGDIKGDAKGDAKNDTKGDIKSDAKNDTKGDAKTSLLQRASRFRAGLKKRQTSTVESKDGANNAEGEGGLARSKSDPSPNKKPPLNNQDKPGIDTKDSNNEDASVPKRPLSSPGQVNSDTTTESPNDSPETTAKRNSNHEQINHEQSKEEPSAADPNSIGNKVSSDISLSIDEHKQDQYEKPSDIAGGQTLENSSQSIPEGPKGDNSTNFSVYAADSPSKNANQNQATTDHVTPNIANHPQMTLDASSRSIADSKDSKEEEIAKEPEAWNVDDALEGTAQLIGTAGGYFFSVLGQVASSAFSLTQSAVTYLVNYNKVETWHDCDSDEGDYDAFQDAVEDLTPKDRLYHICNELLTTEEAYVERLGLLVKAKERTAKIFNQEVAGHMFKDIEVIWKFHHDNLLPQLKDRMKFWLQYEKIGDIMRKLTPFLKLYTEYVKDFQKASALVDSYEDKSSSFASALKKIRENSESPVNRKLKIQAHMMEPIQRVPRYELLLRDYIKRIPPDSVDREDTEEALKSVAEAAAHFEEMIKRDSRIGKLMEIQNKLDGGINIVQPNRELVKEGLLEKVPKKNFSDKYIFLFNDMMLICNRLKLVVTKYKVKHVLNLSDVQVARGLNLDAPLSFAVLCPNKEIDLIGSSAEETYTWFETIQQTIDKHLSKNNEKPTKDETDSEDIPHSNGDTISTESGQPQVLWQDSIHVSPDEGKSWRKRWAVLRSTGKISFYKGNNDNEELSYLNTKHFQKSYTNTPSKKGPAVCLTSSFHKYLLTDENQDIIDSLYLNLTGQAPENKTTEL